jgi:hypothetical protein
VILEPGTFKVRDYRKAIPTAVKLQVVINQFHRRLVGTLDDEALATMPFTLEPIDARCLRFDHRPPLEARPYDTEAGDFIPPQNDPQHIEAITTEEHDFRTFGRKPGAEKTVTTRGSDAGEAARTRNIKDSEQRHQAIMAAKTALAGADKDAVIEALAPIAKKQWPKRKLEGRPFQTKGKRRSGFGR